MAMDRNRLARIRTAAEDCAERQGLRTAVLGVAIVLFALQRLYSQPLWQAVGSPRGGVPSLLLLVAPLAAVLALGWLLDRAARRYYARTYGQARSLPASSWRRGAGGLLVVGLLFAVGLDISLHPRVMVSGLLLALIVLVLSRPALELRWPPRTIRPPDVVLALFITALSLIPVLGAIGNPVLGPESWFPLGPNLQPGERDFAYRLGIAFVGIMVAGLLDHLFLVWRMRSFPAARVSPNGDPEAV